MQSWQIILITVVRWFFEVLRWAILIDCILSFLPIPALSQIRRALYYVLNPIYTPIRKLINKTPLGGGMLDFTPLFALLLISLVSQIIYALIL